MKKKEYRIVEFVGEFKIQVKVVIFHRFLFWEWTDEYWVQSDKYGNPISEINNTYCVYKTIETAKEKLLEIIKGEQYHTI